MTGCERYSNSSGYASTFKYTASHIDKTTRDRLSRRQTQLIAMDAIPYYNCPADQYLMSNMTRDLNKAFVAFDASDETRSAISTGNWGCGAFAGDPQLKFVIQVLITFKNH